jgi:hypothetical protein
MKKSYAGAEESTLFRVDLRQMSHRAFLRRCVFAVFESVLSSVLNIAGYFV